MRVGIPRRSAPVWVRPQSGSEAGLWRRPGGSRYEGRPGRLWKEHLCSVGPKRRSEDEGKVRKSLPVRVLVQGY